MIHFCQLRWCVTSIIIVTGIISPLKRALLVIMVSVLMTLVVGIMLMVMVMLTNLILILMRLRTLVWPLRPKFMSSIGSVPRPEGADTMKMMTSIKMLMGPSMLLDVRMVSKVCITNVILIMLLMLWV